MFAVEAGTLNPGCWLAAFGDSMILIEVIVGGTKHGGNDPQHATL